MTNAGNLIAFEKENCKQVRQRKNEFLKDVLSHRPDLFKYCRRLTSNPWDAEDLVQETLMIAYGRLADKHAGIQNIKSYLFKMATNQWITWCRRKKNQMDFDQSMSEPIYHETMYVVQDSLGTLLNYLPPKELVALVLSEVFESKNEEIAEVMGNTEGAVKSALVRARAKLKNINITSALLKNNTNSTDYENVLDRAVTAFNSRDLESFAKLFSVNAVGNAPGCFFETSAEEIKKGSLFHTINTFDGKPQPETVRAEKIQINGDTLFALFDGNNLDDIWKFTVEENEILRFDCYYCCPDVLTEIAQLINIKANDHGYWFEQNLGKN